MKDGGVHEGMNCPLLLNFEVFWVPALILTEDMADHGRKQILTDRKPDKQAVSRLTDDMHQLLMSSRQGFPV